MNNFLNYKDIMAFHPGYYVAEIIEEMEISQTEFATRLGTTDKTLSKLVNAQISISDDLAKKLSAMLGTSIDLWLNLQKEFDKKIIEIENRREIDAQENIAKLIDYSFFVKVAKLPDTRLWSEKVVNLCQFFKIANLSILCNPDFLVSYRTGILSPKDKNLINAQAWFQTALNFAKGIETASFSAEKLKGFLPEIRSMTVQDPETFLPRLREIFSSCGVAFVLLPHLKNSGINGAVKWINSDRVVLAMNNRRLYADTFWFSLFHEIKHVLQQKIKTVFISSDLEELKIVDKKFEDDADLFAQNYLIPEKEYRLFAPSKYTSDSEIIAFAKKINIHPCIVAGRLQHDNIIAVNRCSQLKLKYQIVL